MTHLTWPAGEADGEQLHLDDPAPFLAVAGDRVVEVKPDRVTVRLESGALQDVFEGWWAWTGKGGKVRFATPDLVGDGPGAEIRIAG